MSYSFRFTIKLLELLLLFSSLPSFVLFSPVGKSLNTSLTFNLYFIFTFLRELTLILIAIQLFLFIFSKIKRYKINNIILILLLPIFSFIYYFFNDFQLVNSLIGIRFYILVGFPILLISDNLKNSEKFNLKSVDRIFFFYLFLNSFTYFFGFNDSYKSMVGSTFLGPRFSFIFENPIVAAMSFGVLILYCNFKISTLKVKKQKLLFLFLSFILFYFCLLTGGRAGLSVTMLITLINICIVYFPKLRKYFISPKSNFKKIFLFSLISFFAFLAIIVSSIGSLSGRSTLVSIANDGIIEGLYGSRGQILSRAITQSDKFQLLIGKPGLGTNTYTRFGDVDKIYANSDSYITALILSFGIIGLIIFFVSLWLFIISSYSPLLPLVFLVFSLSQCLPELIFPWTLLNLLIYYSRILIYQEREAKKNK